MVLPLSSVARRYITLLLLQTRDIPLMMRLPTALRNAASALLPNKYLGSSSLRQQTEKGTKIMIYRKIGVKEICLMFNCWSYPTIKWNMHFFKTVIAGLDSRVIVHPFPRFCFLTRGREGEGRQVWSPISYVWLGQDEEHSKSTAKCQVSPICTNMPQTFKMSHELSGYLTLTMMCFVLKVLCIRFL